MAPAGFNPLAALKNIAKKFKALEASNVDENGEQTTPITGELRDVIKYLGDREGEWRLIHLTPSRKESTLKKIAAQLFSLDELVVPILSLVEHQTLLNARGVCKHFRDLIDTEDKLQQRLHLLPDFAAPEITAVEEFPNGLSYVSPIEETDDDDNLVRVHTCVKIFVEMPHLHFSCRIGTLWRSMLVTQPPVRSFQLIGRCALLYDQDALSCDTGVTLGQVYDCLEMVVDRHNTNCGKECPLFKKSNNKSAVFFFETGNPVICTPPTDIISKKRKMAEVEE